MRQIKFRAFHRKLKEWHYWPLLDLPGMETQTQMVGGIAMNISKKDYTYWCECTGLLDKNKVEIYEGDIGEIRTQSGRVERFVVEWGIHRREMKSGWTVDIPSFCFRIDGFPSFPIVNNYLNGHDLDIIEVIGNIQQNPELLPNDMKNNGASPMPMP